MQLIADIRMQLQTLTGQTTTQAVAGQPFIIQVTVSDIEHAQEPVIEGLTSFVVNRAGYQIMVINGARSVQYRYQVRIDTPGTYQIGPVRIADVQQEAPAQVIAVTASNSQRGGQTTGGKRYAQEQPTVELIVDKDHVYVGQKVRATLRVIVSDGERISLEPIIMQQMQAFHVYHTSDVEQQQVMLHGKGYYVYQVHMDMYPTQAGRKVIPAHFVDYIKEMPMDAFLGGFAALLGSRYERKRIYSNTVTLEVLPLPATDEQAALVGTIQHMELHVEPTVARQYEGIVLKYTIEGDFNADGLAAPELMHMPAQLRYYTSKKDIQDIPGGQRYTAEYIVQGLQPGDYEIPAQSIYYFDTHTGSYKTKTTTPQFITILTGLQEQHTPAQKPRADAEHADDTVCQQDTEHSMIAPLHKELYVHQRGIISRGLPWWMMLIGALLLALWWHWQESLRMAMGILRRIAPAYIRRKEFVRIRAHIKAAIEHHDADRVYLLLKEALYVATQQTYIVTNAHELIAYADTTSWRHEQKEQWRQFIQRLTEHLYAHHKENDGNNVYAAAEFWLDEIERQGA